MKICPQCKSVFPEEDYVYCLTDGTTLVNDSQEEETVVRAKIHISNEASYQAFDKPLICTSCGLANRANSRFCQKCGSNFSPANYSDQAPISGQEVPISSGEKTIFIGNQEPLNNPYNTPTPYQPIPNNNNQMKIAVGVAGGVILLFVILGLASLTTNKSSSANTNNTDNTENSSSEDSSSDSNNESSSLPNTFDRDYKGTMGGKDCSMSLTRDGDELTGKATTNRSFDTLEGTIDSNGEFVLKGFEGGNYHTGNYKGKIEGDTIQGTWTTDVGTKPRLFTLTRQY